MSFNLSTAQAQTVMGMIATHAPECDMAIERMGFEPSNDTKKFFVDFKTKDVGATSNIHVTLDMSQTSGRLFVSMTCGRINRRHVYDGEMVATVVKLFEDIKECMDARDDVYTTGH